MIERLIDEGFGPHNLTVLCTSPRLVEKLREHTVGLYSLGAWGSRGIPVETVARFKGLESEAVILVLEGEQEGRDLVLAYVGLSRARTTLAVVGGHSYREFVNWH